MFKIQIQSLEALVRPNRATIYSAVTESPPQEGGWVEVRTAEVRKRSRPYLVTTSTWTVRGLSEYVSAGDKFGSCGMLYGLQVYLPSPDPQVVYHCAVIQMALVSCSTIQTVKPCIPPNSHTMVEDVRCSDTAPCVLIQMMMNAQEHKPCLSKRAES